MNKRNITFLCGIIILCIANSRTKASNYAKDSNLYKKLQALQVSKECNNTKYMLYGELSGNQKEDCKITSGFVSQYDDIYMGCTKSELQKMLDIVCEGKDPYKKWHALNFSKECMQKKKELFEELSGYQGKDCKIASDLLFENDFENEECTMNELYEMKDACRGKDPFKKWHALEVSKKCYTTKQNIYQRLSGNEEDDLEGANGFFSHYKKGYKGCTEKEIQMMKDAVCGESAVCGGVTVWVSWCLMTICLFIQMDKY